MFPIENEKEVRFYALDGLRGILALSVISSHFIGSALNWSQSRPFSGAYISVIYFFMLSGFVLTYSYDKKISLIQYILRRCARLWPLHVISTIMMIIIYKYNYITGQYVSGDYVFELSNFLKNISFLHGVTPFHFNLVNEPSWSIGIEFWVSIMVPTVFIKVRPTYRFCISLFLLFCLIFVSSTGVVSNAFHGMYQFLISIATMMMSSSIFGILTVYSYAIHQKLKYVEILLWFSLILFFYGVYTQKHNNLDFIYVFAFIPLMFIDYMKESSFVKRLFKSSLISFFGEISFPSEMDKNGNINVT